mmetsp:Transcript_8032/g.14537  ORF Transcript_8032/g.14537 Transcript_8032/m.14537 type:complete len:286 (+) Transcript_8032:944-1801(+)
MARGDGNLREKINKLNKGFDFKINLVGLDDPLGTDTEPQNFDIDRRQCISNLWNPRLAVTVVLASAAEYKPCKIDAKSEAEVDKIMEEEAALKEKGSTLKSSLHSFCSSKDMQFRCPKCKEEQDATQKTQLWTTPDCLILCLKRFNMGQRWKQKIGTKVDYPLTGLNVREFLDEESLQTEEECIYDLVGVVNHLGGISGGHYISYVNVRDWNGNKKDSDGGWFGKKAAADDEYSDEEDEDVDQWVEFDDERYEEIPEESVVNANAYVLFYRRRVMSKVNEAKYAF